MKKLVKLFLFTVTGMFVLLILSFSFITASTFGPVLKDADVTLLDLLRNKVDPEKVAEVESLVKERSSSLGKDAAESVIAGLKKIFPVPPAETYTDNEERPMTEDEALKEGLDILSEMDATNKAILKEAIENMEED